MNWYHLYIEHPTDAFNAAHVMAKEAVALMALLNDRDIAIFSLQNDSGGTNFYFTPSAAVIAKTHKATLCGKPSKEQMGRLVFGDETILDRPFG